jgi:hypothetical protein
MGNGCFDIVILLRPHCERVFGWWVSALFFNVVKAPQIQKAANPTLGSHSFDKHTQSAHRHALGIGVF